MPLLRLLFVYGVPFAVMVAWVWVPPARAATPIAAPPALRPVPAQPAAAADRSPVIVSESPNRLFLQGDDGQKLWRQIVSAVSAERPLVRIQSPDFSASPPGDGFIETSWTPQASAQDGERLLSRAIVEVTPDEGGIWVDTAIEGKALTVVDAQPLRQQAPASFAATVADALQEPWSEVQTVAMWWPEQVSSQDRVAQLPPTSVPATSPQWGDPIVTMPPAYAANSPFGLSLTPRPPVSRFFHKLVDDYRYFYSCESLVCVTGAVGAAALMANTGFDTTMENAWQTGVAPTSVGTFFTNCKPLGEGKYAVPIFGVAALTGVLLEGRPSGDIVGEWGSRSLRMFAVGGPPVLFLQYATGAPRPSENLPTGSEWLPFHHNGHGASGHAFVGAIPFIAAADMVENPFAKGALYVCSTFTGFSRMTTESHYPSQVFLGWYLAFASSMAVNRTEVEYAGMSVRAVPLPLANTTGIGVEGRW